MVDHSILSHKSLESWVYGSTTFCMIRVSFSESALAVAVAHVVSGVAQVIILSSLLFLILMTDISANETSSIVSFLWMIYVSIWISIKINENKFHHAAFSTVQTFNHTYFSLCRLSIEF